MKHLQKVPVIVLPNVVFYPNTSLPLYIADDRYEELIEKALQENTFIGVALENLNSDTDNSPSEVFGIGRPIVLERMENGILKVLLKGVSRAKAREVDQVLPYPIYWAEIVPDDKSVDLDFSNYKTQELKRILNEWLQTTIINSHEREQFLATMKTTKETIDYVCTFLIQDKEVRQILLENTNLENRIELLHLILDQKFPYRENVDVCEALKDFKGFQYIAKVAN